MLRWDTPEDLDLHITGPVEGGGFHVFAWEPRLKGAVRLEGDSKTGPAAETVSIPERGPGIYQVYVHSFSARGAVRGDSLSRSGAHVSVYSGGSVRQTFAVPAGQPGNLWTVCYLSGETLAPVGNMTFESDPRAVGTSIESALIPGDILLGTIDDSLVPGKWSHVAMYAGDGDILEAPAEDGCVEERIVEDWSFPDKTWVAYLRVVSAETPERLAAVEFARVEARRCAPYDVRFYSKQAHGDSWYCSELVWAAYLEGSGGRVNLEHSPDFWGVYPWEIASSQHVVSFGGHYERRTSRGPKVVYLALKTGVVHVFDWTLDLLGWIF